MEKFRLHCTNSVLSRRLFGIRGAGFLSLVWLTLITLSGCGGHSQAAPGGGPPPATVVTTTPLKKTIVQWDEYTGRLEAVDFVQVRARVGGYLESMHFDEGDYVKAGDLLFVVDPRPFRAEVDRAKSTVEQSKAQKKQAEANLSVAQAQRNASQARYDLAQSDLNRAQNLRDRNVITAEEYDNRSAALLEAQANLEQFVAQIEAANAALVTAQADIAVSESALAIAELNLSYTNITSPISGRISQRYVTVGNLISGGSSESTLLTTIVSLDPIYCVFYADENEYLKYARLDQEGKRKSSRDYRNPVFVALADEDEFTHEGHMDFVDNRLDDNTATIRGRAILANENRFLTPGMFVRLRLPGSDRYEAIMLPDQAINTDLDTKFVFVIDDQGNATKKPVKLGSISHGLRIIQGGLDGTENVVIKGAQKIRPGQPLQVEKKPTKELIQPTDNLKLPDEFEVVPREKWLIDNPAKAVDASPDATPADAESPRGPVTATPAPSEPAN